jgi:uncharacterized membrane protein YqjE
MEHKAEGILSSIQSAAALLIGIFHNRLELVSNDFDIARERFIILILQVLMALFFLCFGLFLLASWIIVFFWETHRLLVLGGMSLLFLLIGFYATLQVRKSMRAMPGTFEVSLEELGKDIDVLKSES